MLQAEYLTKWQLFSPKMTTLFIQDHFECISVNLLSFTEQLFPSQLHTSIDIHNRSKFSDKIFMIMYEASLKLAFQIIFTQPDFLWNVNVQIATVWTWDKLRDPIANCLNRCRPPKLHFASQSSENVLLF